MLVVTERDDGFVVIGDIVVYIRLRGEKVSLALDLPDDVTVRRSEVVTRLLLENGFKPSRNNKWHVPGAMPGTDPVTIKDALRLLGE